jgi:hypothetical protein
MNRRLWILLPAVCVLALPRVSAQDEALPKAETILDRFVEVTGGKAAYEKRKSEVTTLEIEFVGRGIKGTMTRYADLSGNSLAEGEFEGIGKMGEGVYNGQAWDSNPMTGARVKTGVEAADAVRDSQMNAQVEWRKYYKAETAGMEKVGDEDAYKVTLTPAGEGKGQTNWYSKKSGLILKMARTISNPMGEIPVEITVGEYGTYGELKYPKKLTNNIMGTQMAITLVSVKMNEDIPKEKFEPPAEVKKLMAK